MKTLTPFIGSHVLSRLMLHDCSSKYSCFLGSIGDTMWQDFMDSVAYVKAPLILVEWCSLAPRAPMG